ncbi:isochorismatase family protein [Pseudonocardia kunmingensis]|uniref:Nicotinamidase-related amidase n=1 Tax=Pseudonocardia kunmingensis TaxID=630975 RepID=A0A543CXF7_9PSEU|nr:isochorismatase family protein [Pseudonocardia kunmingensis]TQM01780.1 nicotinamidase-related amidase [Pseudonocardia kunmingensis]
MVRQSTALALDPSRTAIVLVDLQNGVVGMPVAPLSGDQVVAAAATLARHFRGLGAPVVTVTVAYPAGEAPPVDAPLPPMPATMPPGWDEVVRGLAEPQTDIRVTKSGWGAFAGTGLAETLRERGVDTVVVAGIATNFGVEQTVREAVAHGFAVLVASDATSSVSAEHHEFALTRVLPMISRIRTVDELVKASA